MLPSLVAFDLDDTLAPSKSPLPPEIADALARLLARTEVCIISGGQVGQFESQVLARLGDVPEETLARLHLMPTCGTQYLRRVDGEWALQYAERLAPAERGRAIAALERHARRLGYWESRTWGPIIEDRGSQVTFSGLGQSAPVPAKAAWDPDGAKKTALREAVAVDLPELEVRSGGSTSVDITRRGIDKAYGMRRLEGATGIALDRMVFVGDRLDEDGNDYPVAAMGVRCIPVEGWTDTVDVIEGLLVEA